MQLLQKVFVFYLILGKILISAGLFNDISTPYELFVVKILFINIWLSSQLFKHTHTHTPVYF